MNKLIAQVVVSKPDVRNIEIGAGCGEFGSQFYSECFLTDLKTKSKDCLGSQAPLYFTADATKISDFVPANRFELIICCNPFQYGFKTPVEAFTILEQFNKILIAEKGIVRLIGRDKQNPNFNVGKIERFIKEFNEEHNTKFKITTKSDISAYGNFIFTDHAGVQVHPNTEIIISN